MMTVVSAMIGLTPIMSSIGTGSDVMKRIAAPMVGGLATSFLLELLVYRRTMKMVGAVKIPQEAFVSVLRTEDDGSY
jgi:Cu/Ag efflux pump CusA